MEVGYARLCRYIKTIPAPVVALHRMGKKYCHDKYDLYIERDYRTDSALLLLGFFSDVSGGCE
jgi:hypothetical protein